MRRQHCNVATAAAIAIPNVESAVFSFTGRPARTAPVMVINTVRTLIGSVLLDGESAPVANDLRFPRAVAAAYIGDRGEAPWRRRPLFHRMQLRIRTRRKRDTTTATDASVFMDIGFW
ncbi:hypothetical protein Trydic_g12742 [Trypoxylus dichotomus]